MKVVSGFAVGSDAVRAAWRENPVRHVGKVMAVKSLDKDQSMKEETSAAGLFTEVSWEFFCNCLLTIVRILERLSLSRCSATCWRKDTQGSKSSPKKKRARIWQNLRPTRSCRCWWSLLSSHFCLGDCWAVISLSISISNVYDWFLNTVR